MALVKKQGDFPNVKIWTKFASVRLAQTYETCDVKPIKFASNKVLTCVRSECAKSSSLCLQVSLFAVLDISCHNRTV